MSLFESLLRPFTSNLRKIRPSTSEKETLASKGIENPSMQSYLVWRRSSMIFVVVATLLCAGVSTYRDLFDESERPDIAGMLVSHVSENALLPIPGDIQDSEEMSDNLEEAVDTVKQGIKEQLPSTTPEGSEPEDPEEGKQTLFGDLVEWIQLASLYALPIAASLAVLQWTRFNRTSKIIGFAFAFAFLVPILVALFPWSWSYKEAVDTTLSKGEKRSENLFYGVVYGAEYLITLLPTVLAIVPGVQRACLRIKTLLPQSIVPGWFLVTTAPFYGLFLLVIFVAVNQISTGPFFFAGMSLLVLAPMVYLVRSNVFTSPLCSEVDQNRVQNTQRIVGGMTLLAGGILVAYLMTEDLMGLRIFSLDPEKAILQPLDLIELLLETMGKSIFMTVLAADVFLQVNRIAWKNTSEFVGRPEAEEYDQTMMEVDRQLAS